MLDSVSDGYALAVACGRATVSARPANHALVGETAARVTDWDAALDTASAHGMQALVCARVLEVAPTAVGASVLAQVRAAQLESAAAALAASRQLVTVLDQLSRAGIHAFPYKGPALAMDAYGDAALRTCDDLDIVVAPDELARAHGALDACGYRPVDGLPWADSLAAHDWQGHVALHRAGASDAPLSVELHWRFCDRKLPWTLDVRDVLARSRTGVIAGAEIPLADSADQLVLVLMHAARHGWDRLEPLVSAGALLARGVDAHAVVARARRAGGLRAVLVGLLLTSELFDIELPDVLGREARRTPDAVSRLVAEARGRTVAGDAGDARDLRLHVATLDTLRARMRYVVMAALQPTPRDRDVVALPRALRLLYVPIRLARLLARAAAVRPR